MSMMNRFKMKKALSASIALIMVLTLGGCASWSKQSASASAESGTSGTEQTAETLLEIDDPVERKAVERAKAKVEALGRAPRIIATSPSAADVCDRLELDLVGVCKSNITKIPSRYDGVTQIGLAMSPDIELCSSLDPDWILSPSSLQSDLQPKYEAMGCDWAFLNLKSVQGMYRSIEELGEIFGKEEQAEKCTAEFTSFYNEYSKKNAGKAHPKVMILMGLPGSYIIATENSYVGSLVALAGGENVYAGTNEEFLTVNTEDMKTKEPDVILRCAHALPDQVIEMFKKDFATNDIWQHFDAVKNGRVYDLTYEYFGMSAKFNYPDALEELQPILYPESDADLEEAKKRSDNAASQAEAFSSPDEDETLAQAQGGS